MKKLNLPLLGCLFCFISILTSCEIKDNTPCTARYTYHPLTDEEKSKTPYFNNPDFDTLRFLSNAGDTLTFALQSTDSSWYIEDANRNPNPDGCPDWQYYETKTARYYRIGSTDNLIVSISKKSIEELNPFVRILFNSRNFTYNLGTVDYTGYVYYVGDLIVNGNTYTKVFYEFQSSNNRVNIKGFYNQTNGLIKIEDNVDNLSFSILK